MFKQALSKLAEEISLDEECILENTNSIDSALTFLQKKFPITEFEHGTDFITAIFIRQKEYLIVLSKDPRKPKGKPVLFDIQKIRN